MQQLAYVPLLQALGHAILNSCWQYAALWLLYAGTNVLFALTPNKKYVTSVVAQLAGFVWFMVSFFQGFYQSVPNFMAQSQWGNQPLQDAAAAWLSQGNQLLPYLSILYLLALIFFTVKWLRAVLYAQHLQRTGLEKICVEWRLFIGRLSMQLDVRRKVGIYLSRTVSTPLTVGFFKPVILIPLACLNHLTPAQMESVILHELAHIKRNDYAVNLLLSMVETLLFFNPFMHLLSRDIKKEREHCCDDWVLQYQYDAATYAGALLAIASPGMKATMALYAADKMMLLARIRRIVEQNHPQQFAYKPLIAAIVVGALVIGVMQINPKFQVPTPLIATHKAFAENTNVIIDNQNAVFWNKPLPAVRTTIASYKAGNTYPDFSQSKNQSGEIAGDNCDSLTMTKDVTETLTALLNSVNTSSSPAMAVLQSRLPQLIEQTMANKRMAVNDIVLFKERLQQVIHQLQQQASEADVTTVASNLSDKNNHAVFVTPYNFDGTLFAQYISAQITYVSDTCLTPLSGQADKIIIIELAKSLADTTTQQIIIDGKVFKTIKI